MERKFTQGEWYAEGGNVMIRSTKDKNYKRVIANVHDPEDSAHTTETEKANTKLIANAPLGFELAEMVLDSEHSFVDVIEKAQQFMEKLK